MIVKNESRIMSRCLGALMGLVDYICVCDTGSTDDTVEIIHAFCKEKIENAWPARRSMQRVHCTTCAATWKPATD